MNTVTVKLSPLEEAGLKATLESEGFEFRVIPHAAFSAKGQGVNCTAYRSGKCVVQGKGTEQFIDRYLSAHKPDGPSVAAALDFAVTCVGSDESGKGDFFGPLVVAAVVMGPEDLPHFEGVAIDDSKKLSARQMHESARLIKEVLAYETVVLMPQRYNELYAQIGNLNNLLAWAHGVALEGALEKRDAQKVVVDQFCRRELIVSRMKERTLTKELEIRPKAESNPACGAASILASTTFGWKLKDLGEQFNLSLPKGAGRPVDLAARRLVAAQGKGVLYQVAKVHFANSKRVGG